MSEQQYFTRQEDYAYRNSHGREYGVICEVSGFLVSGCHAPNRGRVSIYNPDSAEVLFEIKSASVDGYGDARGHCLVVSDSLCQSDFELMAYAMKALGDLMHEEIAAYWANFPDGYEQPGVWWGDE